MKWAMRVFGCLNILSSLACIYYFLGLLELGWGKWPGNPNSHEWAVFVAISVASVLLVIYIAYLGVRLILCDYKALWWTGLAFLFEMAYWYIDLLLTWMTNIFRKEIGVGLWGIAISVVDPQVLTGYALVGLIVAIVLIVIRRSRLKTRGGSSQQADLSPRQ